MATFSLNGGSGVPGSSEDQYLDMIDTRHDQIEADADDADDLVKDELVEDDDEEDQGEDFWQDEPDDPCEVEAPEDAEDATTAATPQQRLLRLAQTFQFAEANELLKEPSTTSGALERDRRKRTAAHYAAMHSHGQATLQLLVGLLGADCLADTDASKTTPLHFAGCFHSRKSFGQLLRHAKRKVVELRDINGDSCVHWAGRNRLHGDAVLAALEVAGPPCLAWQNATRRTALCEALGTSRAETVKQLLSAALPDCLTLRDQDGNTWAHFAAENSTDEAALFLAAESAGPDCLGWLNNRKLSVLQVALDSCSAAAAKKLIALAGPETLNLRDDTGRTCLHAAEHNKEEVIQAAVDSVGAQCLSWQNGRKQSVLYDAVMNCSPEFASKLVEMASTDCLSLRDEDGNTCLHEAVRSDSKIDVVLSAVRSAGWWCLSWQNNKKQSVLYLAVSSCSAAAAEHLLKMAPAEVLRVDGDGNTLLHSLFQSEKHRHSDAEIQEFLSMMTTLVGAGVNLQAENNIGQNCLHGTTMLERCLSLIVMKAMSSDATKRMFRQLLSNSIGLHAVHAFASRYRLREVVKPLAKLSEMQVSDLLRLTVTMDTNKGATCLHFACEAGHKENIRFLVNQGLLLPTVTHAGLSCIDYAYDKGKLEEVLQVAEDSQKDLSKTELWRLVDPVQRALKLPDRSFSRQLLASIAHESMRADAKRDNHMGECGGGTQERRRRGSGGSLASLRDKLDTYQQQKKDLGRTDWDVLFRALELDSSRIFRSALSLNLVTADTERFLPNYVTQKLKQERYDNNRHFTQTDVFLEQELFSSLSELSAIDIAAFFDKVDILPDLILTRQFELIPACTSLLVHLAPKIAQGQGKHEQLKKLQSKITCIVVNALDELYVSESEDEKTLLVDYIRGELRDDDGQNPGPLFPCRCADDTKFRSIEYLSLMDMMEEANCRELIETDCLHRAAKKAWHPSPPFDDTEAPSKAAIRKITNPVTPRVKFYIHHVAFVIFLAYSAWYIIDFRATFVTPIPDVVLTAYAVSFTVQEATDFWRRRKLKNFYVGRRVIRFPAYFEDAINFFDCFALLSLWIGLVWKWVIYQSESADHTAYACQMVLSTSFMLWGFRSVSFLSYHERAGPVISMLSSLLILDLLPFLAIILVIFYVFGVFFFNLLFPAITASPGDIDSSEYGWRVFLQVFTLPFNLLFTHFDKIGFEAATLTVNQSIGKVANPVGLGWFTNLLLYVFLLLVNIVMLNLLIALFSLRVSRMDSRALGIWRRTYFEMLREFQSIGPVPPPLSFLSEIGILIARAVRRSRRINPTDGNEWWLSERNYPDEYVRFLKFQAIRFRRVRPQLTREVTRNRSDFDGLKAHTGNLLDTLEQRLDARIEVLTDRQEEGAQKFAARFDRVERSFSDRLQRLDPKTGEAPSSGDAGQQQKQKKKQQQGPQQQQLEQQQTVEAMNEKLKLFEAKVLAEVRSIGDSMTQFRSSPEQLLVAQKAVAAQCKKTDEKMRRQRKKMKELDNKMDTVVRLLQQQQQQQQQQ